MRTKEGRETDMVRWGKKDADAEGEATGMSDEMDLCPVCGSLVGEEHAGYERKGDLRVTRVVKCPKCHTKSTTHD